MSIITKGLIGLEDFSKGNGTFSRSTSTAGTITLSQVPLFSGTGSPEGVVTAGVGCLYSRSDGSGATALYIKGSGTGNTGWLTVSSIGGSLNQADLAPFTGSSSAQTFYATSIPAAAVGNLKGIRITAGWTHSSGSASIAYTATFNGVSLPGTGSSNAANGSYCVTILNTGATTGTANGRLLGAGTVIASAPSTLAGLSWASLQAFQMRFNVAPSDQITPIQLLVEILP